MVLRTHLVIEETVGEYIVSLNLPVGLSFGTAKGIVQNMKEAVEKMEKQEADRLAELAADEEAPAAIEEAQGEDKCDS